MSSDASTPMNTSTSNSENVGASEVSTTAKKGNTYLNNSLINRVLIAAGTHGNELSGIELVRNIQARALNNSSLSMPNIIPEGTSFSVEATFVNELAIEKRSRFVEEDLNRQFSQEKLSVLSGESLEHQLAIEFNHKFGPKAANNANRKASTSVDLLIDIHNTTSNMGPTLIVLECDDFHIAMSRYIKAHMPEAIILIEDEKPYLDHAYLCTVGKRGVMIEVGPQPQGVLRPQAYLQTEKMTQLLLQFCQLWNQSIDSDTAQQRDEALDTFSALPEIEAFRLTEEVRFPADDANNKTAMIHPELQNRDFIALKRGDPVFLGFNHEAINWEGDNDVYPHFIGESAYYHLNIAFALASKTRI